MTAKAKKMNGKYRLVDDSADKPKIIKRAGHPVDGGGHRTGSAAERHAQKLNWSKG